MGKKLIFDVVRNTLYSVDKKTGKVEELESKDQEIFSGKKFSGASTYEGKWKNEVSRISKPFLFVKPDSFLDAAGFDPKKLPEKKIKTAQMLGCILSQWVDCYVIAQRAV
jgi:hypothetical protein